jgi:hypothetical protein
MGKVRFWSLTKFNTMVIRMLLNKFDCVIIIEGNRGLGKSTLAWHILKGIHRQMKYLVRETGGRKSPYYNWYSFKPHLQAKGKFKSVIYTRDDVINFFDKWHHSAIADEMINVTFNREFWNEDQKNIIKLMNMNRDHGNLFIACVPQFQTLDNQIKNLCKIRITIARRGLSVIQTPNRTIYNRDKWDTANNEKIEREWLKKGSGLPQYSRLNTFRGMLKFSALPCTEQTLYDTIKINERNTIKKTFGINRAVTNKEKDPVDIAMETLKKGGIRNAHVLDGLAMAKGIDPENFKNRIRRKLRQEKISHSLPEYYWDKKVKKEELEKEKDILSLFK